MKLSRTTRLFGFPFLLALLLFATGCNNAGVGETVPSPPRELVEKSFHPPAASSRPGGASGTPSASSQADAANKKQ